MEDWNNKSAKEIDAQLLKVGYNDIYKKALQHINKEDFEIQHKIIEVLKDRGYV